MKRRITSWCVSGCRRGATLLALSSLSLWGMACSSALSGTPGDSGPTADMACTDTARATCTEAQTCTPATVQATYGDEPTCEVRIKASCLNTLAAPGTGGSPAKTEACAQAYATYGCADYRNRTNIPAACQQVTGSVANGSACEFAGQCQSGFCAIVPGNACGTCAITPQQGDSCAQLTSCGQTLTCTIDTLVCTSLAAQGQSCGQGQPCGAGLSCVAPGGDGTPGTCQPAGAQVGAACDGSLKTSASCDNALGLYCDGTKKECAQTTYAGDGQACGYDSVAATNVQCTGGTCEGAIASQAQLGTCAGRAADDGLCVVPDGGASTPSAGCLPPARCVAAGDEGNTCQVVTASGCQ